MAESAALWRAMPEAGERLASGREMAAGVVRAAAGRVRGLDSRRLVAMQSKRKGTRGGVEWLSDRLG
ncbi:unnamed protein product [Linum trigynum]|uniref:Uncharacterized protein n=1 Tax=Linum trigynum TaxID=586398 RepID=A0AAV2F7K0_9ROSI